MLKVNTDDTIAAISTAAGSGGIGIVRISGKNAISIADSVFSSPRGKRLMDTGSHTISFGHIVYGGQIIDEVLVSVMRAPHSYTCEDIAEINTHGGYRSLSAVLGAVIKSGARLAEPGEFTKRAFLNGRIDLTQAEAVMDIINAGTDKARQAAMTRLSGRLSKEIGEIREGILTMLAHIEAGIDYPEHDDETMTYSMIGDNTKKALAAVDKLIAGADMGRIYKEGVKTVILGCPNVGKSSLLNALLEEERAIVTDIPGTTRDSLEEMINVHGIPLKIADTAGIRATDDIIERMGVEKSKSLAEDADLILLMLDGSRELGDDDRELIALAKGKKCIVLVNKSDCERKADASEIASLSPLSISAKHGEGIEELFARIRDMFSAGELNTDNSPLISGERNKASLMKAKHYLENVLETVEKRMPEDFISMDMTEAYSALGEITGEALEEDILDKIFSEFCLGK